MSTYAKQMQDVVEDYRASGQPWPTTAKAIAAWAISTGRWELPRSAAISTCASDIASAMREEYVTDPKGRRVRVKHPAKIWINGEQTVLWDDMRTATRRHMQVSFQNRRQGIVSDCRQLKADCDSYNDSRSSNEPLQIVFDFTMDLAEAEAAEATA
jgi:hypothetical protein